MDCATIIRTDRTWLILADWFVMFEMTEMAIEFRGCVERGRKIIAERENLAKPLNRQSRSCYVSVHPLHVIIQYSLREGGNCHGSQFFVFRMCFQLRWISPQASSTGEGKVESIACTEHAVDKGTDFSV